MSQGNSTSRRKALIGLGAAGAAAAGGGYFIFGNGDENGEDDDPLNGQDPGSGDPDDEEDFEFSQTIEHPSVLMGAESDFVTEISEETTPFGTQEFPSETVLNEITVWDIPLESIEMGHGGIYLSETETDPGGEFEKVEYLNLSLDSSESDGIHIYAEPDIEDDDIVNLTTDLAMFRYGTNSASRRFEAAINNLEEGLNEIDDAEKESQAEDYLAELGSEFYELEGDVLSAQKTTMKAENVARDLFVTLEYIRPVFTDLSMADWYGDRATTMDSDELYDKKVSAENSISEIDKERFVDWMGIPEQSEEFDNLVDSINDYYDVGSRLMMTPFYDLNWEGDKITELKAVTGESPQGDVIYETDGLEWEP